MSLKESIENVMASKNKNTPLKLLSTAPQFSLEDESGYKFEIYTNLDSDTGGWGASVRIFTEGMATEKAALSRLLETGKHFIRMMEEDQ